MLKTGYIAAIAFLLLTLLGMGLFHTQILAFFNKKKATDPAQPNSSAGTGTTGLDMNKVLKKGVYDSEEVRQLQQWLGGLDPDGDFGPKTEARLMAVKGVKETTLTTYPTLSNTQPETTTDSGSGHQEAGYDWWPDGWKWH